MITPTIGRVIWFYKAGNTDPGVQAEPAFITYVYSDTLINVGGFDRNGSPFGRTSVVLVQKDDTFAGEHARWMPYQKQAQQEREANVSPAQRADG